VRQTRTVKPYRPATSQVKPPRGKRSAVVAGALVAEGHELGVHQLVALADGPVEELDGHVRRLQRTELDRHRHGAPAASSAEPVSALTPVIRTAPSP
jgi:hypothetical protein